MFELKSQAEIDFIAYNDDMEHAIFGECKWRNEPLAESIIEELIGKCGMFKQFKQKYFFLFSKSGFTSAVLKRARENDTIRLIDFGDMFECR